MQLRKNMAISENGFLFNPSTGDSYSANPVAAEILNRLRAGDSPDVVKQSILEKYDVTTGELEKDWDDFVAQLRAAQLLA